MAFVLCQTLLPAAMLAWLIAREIEQNLGSQYWTAGFALRLITHTDLCGWKFAKQDFIGPKLDRLEVGILGSITHLLMLVCFPLS